jgi:hypothetical protein
VKREAYLIFINLGLFRVLEIRKPIACGAMTKSATRTRSDIWLGVNALSPPMLPITINAMIPASV